MQYWFNTLTFLRTAKFLYNLFFIFTVCGFQDNSESINTPKNFVTYTLSILKSLMYILQSVFKCFLPNTIKLVLLIFKDNLLAANQVWNLFNSSETVLHKSFILSAVQKILVSSANIIRSVTFEILHISLIYRINNFGPSIEPCGTPHITSCNSDFIPLKLTNCLRFNKYDFNQLLAIPLTP